MNLAWEVNLMAQRQGVDRDSIRYVQGRVASPYMELSFDLLNTELLYGREVEINALYRFTAIFGQLLDINLEEYPQLRQYILDAFMHYQNQIDLRQGLTRDEYYIRAILRDILSGVYGERMAVDCTLFDSREMRSILYGILSASRIGTSMHLFQRVMRTTYPGAIVYRNNDVFREILVYIGWPKNERDQRRLDLIISLFLDVNYTVYIFWEHHFGIIGFDSSLQYDDMLIF